MFYWRDFSHNYVSIAQISYWIVNSDGRHIARFGSTALTFEVSGNKILDQSLVASDQYHTQLLSKIWDLRDRKICGQIHLKRVHLGDPPLAEKNFHFFSSFSLICICSWPFSWSRPSKTFDWWTEDTNANQCQPMKIPMPTNANQCQQSLESSSRWQMSLLALPAPQLCSRRSW